MFSARRSFRLKRTADIRRVPTGSDPAARETVAAGVACSDVYPASVEQVERAGLASAARVMVVYCHEVVGTRPDWKLATGTVEYRIRAVSLWPREGDETLMELLLEED